MSTATTTRALELRDQLSRRILVADGAMGTMLYGHGVFINRCFDELSLSNPDLVGRIHRAYADAGAEILETNTFGANRARLSAFGLADKLQAINQAGVRLAREAAQGGPFIAGAMGPLGVRIEPLGPTSFAEARAIFREQAEALLAAGADLLILETFSDLNELREAVLAAREAAGDDPVIIAQVTIDDFGNLASGAMPESVHARDEFLAGGRDRDQLLGRPEDHAGVHRAHGRSFPEAAQRHAQRRPSGARGGPQHLPVLAGIHGAVCAPPAHWRE